MDLAFPVRFGRDGRTALADPDRHLRDLVELVLFTVPGERVNRPDFGCGLLDLVFAGNDTVLETAAQLTVQAALQRALGDRVAVDEVRVESDGSVLRVTVGFRALGGSQRRVEQFERVV